MKKIQPVICFAEGKLVTLSQISVGSASDNLLDTVTFEYTLSDKDGLHPQKGTVTLTSDKYAAWDASADGAYAIVAKDLGLGLL